MQQHEVDAGQVIGALQRQIADQALTIATQQAMIEKLMSDQDKRADNSLTSRESAATAASAKPAT